MALFALSSINLWPSFAAPPPGVGPQFAPNDAFYVLTQPHTALSNGNLLKDLSNTVLHKVLTTQASITCGTSNVILPGSSFNVLANSLGTHKGLRIAGIVRHNNIGAKDSIFLRLNFGSNNLFGFRTYTQTGAPYYFETIIYNRINTNSQVSFSQLLMGSISDSPSESNIAAAAGTVKQTTVDSTLDQILTFECQDDSAVGSGENNDAVNLEMLVVELLP